MSVDAAHWDTAKVTVVPTRKAAGFPRIDEELVNPCNHIVGNGTTRVSTPTREPTDNQQFAIVIWREVVAGGKVSVVCHL